MERRSKVTSDQLHQMAEHVQYEIDMFRKCFKEWRALEEGSANWNSALENALLHFRVLREFFCSQQPKWPDDVIAAQYVAPAGWRAPVDPILDETKEDVDKRLAHLTLRRLKAVTAWKRGEMEAAVERLIKFFKNSLQHPKSEWFSRLEVNRSSTGIIVGDISPGTQSVRIVKVSD